jgi:hypothetical protein
MRRFLLALRAPGVCLGILLCSAPFILPGSAEEAKRRDEEVGKLIRQLGSDDFPIREEATRRLLEREDATPALREALKSKDKEVARRARQILAAFARRDDQRAKGRLAALAKAGQVDQAVELFVRRPKWDNEEDCWRVMAELAARLLERERQQFGKASLAVSDEVPVGNFRKYLAIVRPKVITGARPSICGRMKSCFLVRAEEISIDDLAARSILLASGNVRASRLFYSVLFSGGSLELEALVGSVLVCDGECAIGIAKDSLIIARGGVRCSRVASNCRIITPGRVVLPPKKSVRRTTTREKEATPLGLVKFFDPSEVGLTVGPGKGGVQVKGVKPGLRFARAGLKMGDQVLSVGGSRAASLEEFRRALRGKLAAGGAFTLKVRRGGRVLDLSIPDRD